MSLFNTEAVQLRVSRQGVEPLAPPPRPGALLDILISDALARYWILDRPAGLASAAELDAYAADRYAELFGDDPAGWVIRVDPLPGADRWLACALPTLFAVDLPRLAEEKGWRLRSVQPRFIREYNRHCGALGPDTTFCVASRESTTIGLIAGGSWRGIRVHPPLDRSAARFSTLLRRDCRQAGITDDGRRQQVVGSLRDAACH